VIAAVPLFVTLRDAVNPLPQSVCTLYAALQDEVAARAGTPPALPATARPNAASKAAAVAAIALRALLGKSLIVRHLQEICHCIGRGLPGSDVSVRTPSVSRFGR
jgi:hypothetical protein